MDQKSYDKARKLGHAAYKFAFECYKTFDDKSYWGGLLNKMKYQTEQPTKRMVDST